MTGGRRVAILVVAAVAAAGSGIGLGLGLAGGPAPPHRAPGTGTATPATSAAGAPAGPTTAPAPGTAPHVMLVVMENHRYGQIVGSPTAPYLNSLIARYGLATSSYADTHPSLPNYLDLVSGSTQGITSDCGTCVADGQQLVDQMEGRGIGWRAYIESMPGPCFTGATSLPYDRNHNPFVYAPHLVRDAAECANVVPYRRLAGELSGGTAPPFLWVTPDVEHDMHTGTVREGDTWLSRQLPLVLRSSWYQAGGAIVITFDEGVTDAGCCGGAAGGHIATVVVSAATPPGARMANPVDHAGVLRTLEELYGLPFLGAAADPASGTLLPLLGRPPG